MSDRPDLAAFQKAAVDHIVVQLTRKHGSRRFLLADEVGLGKTIVASEVIHQLAQHHALRHQGESFNVVYLCSNAEIAEQNRRKLVADAGPPVRRITKLAIKQKNSRLEVRLFSFTPGTSLYAGTGIAWERQLILFLLGRIFHFDIQKKPWQNYLRCTVRPDNWERQARRRRLDEMFFGKTSVDFQRQLSATWRAATVLVDKEVLELRKVLPKLVESFNERRPSDVENRNRVIGVLRTGLQEVALAHINAHLVILDEVQRFKEILEINDRENSLERRLFAGAGTQVLILSATPYRLLTLDHEADESGAGHYENFLEMLRFLFNDEEPVRKIKMDLARFREQLKEGHFLSGPDDELRSIKLRLEDDLTKVVSRTERNWYVEDVEKGIQDVGLDGVDVRPPPVEELAEFIRLRRFLGSEVPAAAQITEYWKSAPSVLTFMDHHYAVMRHLKKRNVPRGLISEVEDMPALAERSHRFRAVLRSLWPADSDAEKRTWRFLWVQPTYKYYRDQFFRGEDPPKLLLFSSWRFVPKAVSILLSAEAQRCIRPRTEDDENQPLRFAEKDQRLAFHIFDLCFPTPALARVAPLASWADEEIDVELLIRRAEKAVEELLISRGVLVGDAKQGALWQVAARLDATEPDAGASVVESMRGAEVRGRSGQDNVVFDKYRRQWIAWVRDTSTTLRVNRTMVSRLARIALFSPAVSLLRALWGALPGTFGSVPRRLVETCLTELRAYLNRGLVRAIVEDHQSATKPSSANERGRLGYTDRVLAYCRDAHLQSVLDEYVWLRGEAIPSDDPKAVDGLISTFGQVLGLSTGTPRTNGRRGKGPEVRIEPDDVQHRAHFAIAFGDVAEAETEDTANASGVGRRTAVREAFNSPFWPFVLTTTSVGQEGLDFHLFCRDVVHWNLPWNPVDLEQREGRINRRNSLAIRRSIAAEWPLSRLSRENDEPGTPWRRLFAAIVSSNDGQRYKRGLFPSWIYDCRDAGQQARIRRHLPFHPMSDDAQRYAGLKDRLVLYRLVFGQPRQQDLLEHLQLRLEDTPDRVSSDFGNRLAAYMINLSPFPKSYAHELAGEEAMSILRSPDVEVRLRRLLAEAAVARCSHAPALSVVARELDALVAVVESRLAGSRAAPRILRQAVAALAYLVNPFDDKFDIYGAVGLEDDIKIIREAYAQSLSGV